ncbi:BPS1-like protein (DUF793) [Rhynchospora pubera]|uniref:BPS1-like protein (DUF793) n=1 Tax=Rhynchospora pubera TaxID=906938 RepID=A0AAV8C8L0_9POAL|nr:BPS1-like protein (DUF793) [Rhynchospora pubera]KAJ4795319.1 BPS1-like protein (DUF793) [Rhynchospora pubera]
MKPYTLLRTLSTKLSSKHSSCTVTPWPPVRTAFDNWFESEIEDLRFSSSINQCTSAKWLGKALDLTISSQKMLIRSMSNLRSSQRPIDTKMVDEYLEDSVQLLDACNGLRERIDVINQYIKSIHIALHWIDESNEPSETAIRRAQSALSLCEAVERRCLELEKCGSNLRKLGEKISKQSYVTKEQFVDSYNDGDEFKEAIIGSRAMTIFVVTILGIAFSFKSRRGVPLIHLHKNSIWENSFHELHKEAKEEFDKRRKDGVKAMVDLDATASAAKKLREVIAIRGRSDLKSTAEMLRKTCIELEQRIRPFENKVNELFREIVEVRMGLFETCTM